MSFVFNFVFDEELPIVNHDMCEMMTLAIDRHPKIKHIDVNFAMVK